MLPGAAVLRTTPTNFPGAWVFVVGVILLIVLIFLRMYGGRARSGRRRTAHRSGRQTAHSASREPERGGDHEHRAVSRRRPNQP